MRIVLADATTARAQSAWIATMEPWASLGYHAETLRRWLGRMAKQKSVWVAGHEEERCGIIVVQAGVLLGDFIALVAVHPSWAAQGVGRLLVEGVAARTFRHRRWLYVSSDSQNRVATRFYRKLGFRRVGRLPGLLLADRVEVLWRLGQSPGISPRKKKA